jgi:hypothetical protein
MVQQLEEDIDALVRHLSSQGPLPLNSLRVTAPPILRRWLSEQRINYLANKLGVSATFRTLDTKHAFDMISADSLFRFYTAGGVSIDGQVVQHLYVHDGPAQSKPLIEGAGYIMLSTNKLIEQQRTYFGGRAFKHYEILQYVANKKGGVHFDVDASEELYNQCSERQTS